VNDIEQIISRLEHQRAAIDRSDHGAARIESPSRMKASVSVRAATRTVHRSSSANLPPSPRSAKEPLVKIEEPKKRQLTAAGRKKLSLAAKKRWAMAKRQGINAITGKPLGKPT
jgi:hypothetical protein